MTPATNTRPASVLFQIFQTNRFALTQAALAALFFFSPAPARALVVNGLYTEDPLRCDTHVNQNLGHEIGETAAFPIDERISVFVSPATSYVCLVDDTFPNDFVVQMTNLSPYSYVDLFFVADNGIIIGNADGMAEDLTGAPGILADAFRIDGTVTITGVNDSLFNESGIVNEIFEPGETWRFLVTNVSFPANIPPLLVFDSAGGFAGSSTGYPPSTASILGTQVVPEPYTALLFGFGLAALVLGERRGA
jgi:hypothetical protein